MLSQLSRAGRTQWGKNLESKAARGDIPEVVRLELGLED